MRCLSLAEALPVPASEVLFLCRPHEGNSIRAIQTRGFAVHEMSRSNANQSDWLGVHWTEEARETIASLHNHLPAWLIVDHYGWHRLIERPLMKKVSRLLILDDLANRSHDCDVLLDQNLGRQAGHYQALIPKYATSLVGVQYALLRRDFIASRERALHKRSATNALGCILLSLGGSDPRDYTSQVLGTLAGIPQLKMVKVLTVIGSAYPYLERLRQQIDGMNLTRTSPVELLVNIDDMPEKMLEADLAIGAGGSTAWERCALGLPSVSIQIADNQAVVLQGLHIAGASVVINDPSKIPAELPSILIDFLDPVFRHAVSLKASALVDGMGCDRVVGEMQKRTHCLRPLRRDDLDWLLDWRNHPKIRHQMLNQHKIQHQEHLDWFERTINEGSRTLLVYELGGTPMGYVNFSPVNEIGECEWGFYTNPVAPRGTGMAMGRLALYHAFDVLNATVLIGDVISSNQGSIDYHQRLGFVSVKEQVFKNNEMIQYRLSRTDWCNI